MDTDLLIANRLNERLSVERSLRDINTGVQNQRLVAYPVMIYRCTQLLSKPSLYMIFQVTMIPLYFATMIPYRRHQVDRNQLKIYYILMVSSLVIYFYNPSLFRFHYRYDSQNQQHQFFYQFLLEYLYNTSFSPSLRVNHFLLRQSIRVYTIAQTNKRI